MIIECPVCTTRYNIDAVFPPGGKTVRCAKCGEVWRALPISGDDEGEDSSLTGEAEAATSANAAVSQDGAPAFASDDRDAARRIAGGEADAQDAADPEPSANRQYDETADLPATGSFETAPALKVEEDAPQIAERPTAKVRFFGGFRRKSEPSRDEHPRSFGRYAPGSASEPIPFPRPDALSAPDPFDTGAGEVQTLEEARAAVRSVFSSLGEPRSAHPRGRSYAMPVLPSDIGDEPASRAGGGEDRVSGSGVPGHDGLGTAEPRETSDWHIPDAQHGSEDGRLRTAAQELGEAMENFALEQQATDRHSSGDDPSPFSKGDYDEEVQEGNSGSESVPDEDVETDAFLRAAFIGAVARRDTLPVAEAAAFSEDRLAEELQSRLQTSPAGGVAGEDDSGRTDAIWSRPAIPAGVLLGRTFPRDLDDDPGEPLTEAGEQGGFDDRLFKDIASRGRRTALSRRDFGGGTNRGGLALAAGWGLFLCAASGLIAGFFAFRDIAVEALPGLAPVYRTVGLPVTVQPLAFENVDYTWETEGAKPVLRVRGSVVNRAHRKVKVPSFFVLIRDADPDLDREYSVSLTSNGKIRSGQHAEFDIELVSVTPAITAVELELRSVR